MKIKILVIFFIMWPFFQSCRTLREAKTLSKCEFKLGSLEKPELAGIKLYEIKKFSDLSIKDMGKLTSALARGELPLEFVLNLEVKNPNTKKAGVNKVEWIAFIDDVEICKGNLEERIEVEPNGGTAVIPLHINTNLNESTSYESAMALVNFGLNLADASHYPTRVTLQIKPTISFGKKMITYPGFIKVNREFSSE
ncbi:MAG: hypothetical protein JXB49_36225 [Bacteroidales bacterium]|nr:hypothetical protein [Bacteroidales bacterium]